jgi:catechol 2,3-dioxygenase-like lactoylglutathione lyase family enzyme
MAGESSRRRFIRGMAAASAAVGGAVGVSPLPAQQAGRIRGFDHVALPMENTGEMLAFYRALGCDVIESATACSVHFGDNMINFHRPAHWQDKTFTNRAPAAVPPCGDLCFVWEGTAESVKAALDRAGAKVEVGPVPREGGRRKTGSSVYVLDPDGNLLEFMIYHLPLNSGGGAKPSFEVSLAASANRRGGSVRRNSDQCRGRSDCLARMTGECWRRRHEWP